LKEQWNHSQVARDAKMALEKAVLQDWYFSTEARPFPYIGYRYPGCTNKMLRLLEHAHEIPHADAGSRRPICSNRATCELQTVLTQQPTVAQEECIARLRAAWTHGDWTPDVALKSFFDLDAVYFGGHLRGKCRLRWKGSK
jgi:hypothetical protein